MKKIFNEILVIGLFIFFVSLNALTIFSSKITYKDFEIKKSMSVDDVEEVFEKTDIVTVRCKLKYNEFKYTKITKELISDDESIKKERRELNEAGGNYHSSMNEKIAKEIGDIAYKSCYISKYSPYIEYEFDSLVFSKEGVDILKGLDKNTSVDEVVVVNGEEVMEEQMYTSARDINLLSDYNNGYPTGAGVNIGLLESGIINKNHENISGSNYEIRSYILKVRTDHATHMASIIAGNTGYAHDAMLYNAFTAGGLTQEIDWLVEKNVDLVNMSFRDRDRDGYYGEDSAVVDFYAKTYNMLFVVAAGNNGEETGQYITNPGLAYNALTVGSCVDDDAASIFTSINTVMGPAKPTLVMLGTEIYVPTYFDNVEGTSYSTAMVTGAMGMIYELYPTLKTQPERAIALATASAQIMNDYNPDEENGLNNVVGAGLFRYDTIKSCYSNSTLLYNQASSGNRVAYTRTVRAEGASKIKVCITWFANATGDPDDTTFNDYDIRIYNSSGQYVATSSATENNLEVLTFNVPYTDTYTIQIYQYDTTSLTQRIGFAYQIIPFERE